MTMYNDMTELVGGTPLLLLNRMAKDLPGRVAVKLEFYNPCGSVKDRIGWNMIRRAEEYGDVAPGGTIVEPTSGNTGIALAFVSAVRGYKLVLTMPESMSMERRALLKGFGAELVLTPAEQGMRGAVEKAEEIAAERGAFMPQQFKNGANPEAHHLTTAEEIWKDTAGEVNIFVAGVGTGGTITGVGRFLKRRKPEARIVAVEPEDSPVLSGGEAGPHKIEGIGAGFVPDVLDRSVIDEIITVSADDAMQTSRRLMREEGVLCGISAGANVFAALEFARLENSEGKLIVTLACDTGERYLSTGLFREQGE